MIWWDVIWCDMMWLQQKIVETRRTGKKREEQWSIETDLEGSRCMDVTALWQAAVSGMKEDSQRSIVRTVRSFGIPIIFFKAVVRRPFVIECMVLGACWRYILLMESTVQGTSAPSKYCREEEEASRRSICWIWILTGVPNRPGKRTFPPMT